MAKRSFSRFVEVATALGGGILGSLDLELRIEGQVLALGRCVVCADGRGVLGAGLELANDFSGPCDERIWQRLISAHEEKTLNIVTGA